MIRCRFKAYVDWRPIKPAKHPYWCSGEGEGYFTVVAYADNEEEILALWPDAADLDSEERERYEFSSRFPCPSWFILPPGYIK